MPAPPPESDPAIVRAIFMTLARSLETLIRQLHQRRGREKRALALAEGVRLVEEAVAAKVSIHTALLAPGLETTPRGVALAERLRAVAGTTATVTDGELAKLSATDQPQGVLAVIEPPVWRMEDLPTDRSLLVLDGVQDPGNVGTMLRTAWALGAGGVVALPGTAEFTNPKVLRASMGGFFRMPCPAATVQELAGWSDRHSIPLWITAMDGEPLTGRPPGPVALAVGNEGAGISPGLAGLARRRVAIPLRRDAESLNVAVAAGILLYEVLRER